MTITEIPKRYRFACDATNCDVSIDFPGHPHESTPDGWLSMRVVDKAAMPGGRWDRRILFCPKHATGFLGRLDEMLPP